MSKPTIYITRKIHDKYLASLKEQFIVKMWEQEDIPVPREVLKQEISHADGLLCLLTDQIDDDLLAGAPQLKIIANMAVGYDNIDIEAAKRRQIIVTNTPDVLTETTADLTFALLMATARRLIEAYDYIKEDHWQHWSPFLLAGTDIHHKTLGIVGMGRIGEAVAQRAMGFNMKILYHNRSRKLEVEQKLGATYVTFEQLLKEADFVVCLVPLTEETKYLFDAKAFRLMKSSAIFVNASRGQTVNEADLIEALRTKQIAGAGLDVFAEEPIRSDHPLMHIKEVVCLPHIGSASMETRQRMIELCIDNLVGYFQGTGVKTPVYDIE